MDLRYLEKSVLKLLDRTVRLWRPMLEWQRIIDSRFVGRICRDVIGVSLPEVVWLYWRKHKGFCSSSLLQGRGLEPEPGGQKQLRQTHSMTSSTKCKLEDNIKMWTEYIWRRARTSGRLLWTRWWIFGLERSQGLSWPVHRLWDSEELLRPLNLFVGKKQ